MEAPTETSTTGSTPTSSMLDFLRRHAGCTTGPESAQSRVHFDDTSGSIWATFGGSPTFTLYWLLLPESSQNPLLLTLRCPSCGESLELTLAPKPSPGKP